MVMSFNLVLFFTIILVIFWVMKIAFNYLPEKDLKLLRILFPSWKFFEAITPFPKIFYRISHNGTHYSEWLSLPPSEPIRNIKNLIYNPEGNLYLAYQGQIEQLLNDITELSSSNSTALIESLTSYKIVYSYIKEQILLRHKGKYFQFKIGALEFTPNTPPEWVESLYSHDCELI